MLPNYLKYSPDAKPLKNNVIERGIIRFTILSSRMIRIEQGEFTDDATLSVINRSFDNPEFELSEENGILTIKTSKLKLKYLCGKPLSEESLSIRLLDKPYTEWHYGEKESFNLGGTLRMLDRVTGSCDIDDGICSIDGYSVIDDSKTALIVNEGWFENRPDNVIDIYFLGYGHDYTNCVKDYYRLTGVPAMLPAFALGNWWSRYHKYYDKEYLGLMDSFRDNDIPFSVAIIDMDWHITKGDGKSSIPGDWATEGWTGYTWNEEYFPDYKTFLKELKAKNVKTALNLHPHLGVRKWEAMYEQMAEAMGMDPKDGKAVPFDCLDPKFLKAYFEILHFPYEEDGVDFWWMDWQQRDSYWWSHFYGCPENELEKSITPLWLLNHTHFLASKRNGNRGFVFSRYAGHGSQRYPIGFSGDTYIGWESLDFQPYFTVTASNIGYGWWSHDIGGHLKGVNDDELTTRWIQFGVFSPIFRMHCACDIMLGREPWNYNLRSEKVISDFMRLRHQLFPYLYTMNYRNYNDLLPLMRPLYHTNPEEKDAYKVKNEYWFGSEFIVAPITKKSDPESQLGCADVWLPDGIWIDWFNGYIYKGGRFEAYRTLEQMPIFLKAGAIVPMQAHVANDNHLGCSENLEIIIAAGGNNEFTIYEDDGISENFQNGNFCNTKLSVTFEDNKSVFTIEPSTGNTQLIPQQRNYKLLFKGYKKGCHFFIAGKEIMSEYNDKINEYTVVIPNVAVSQGASVEIRNDEGLLHDNSDYDSRVYDIVAHGQCHAYIQELLMRQKEELKTFMRKTVELTLGENKLPSAIYELAKQIKRD